MTFWKAAKSTYGGAAAFLLACPLLALIPVVSELLQHVAEVHIGMYDSVAAAKAVEHHPLRMVLGMVKILALTVPTYWVSRYLYSRSPVFAARVESPAVGLFAFYLLFQMVFAAANLALAVESVPVFVATFVVGLLISALVAAWGVAASLGNSAVGPSGSARLMVRHLPWTIALGLAATLPLMIIHYAAAAFALLGPKALLWPILIGDSLLVGFLSPLIIAASYFAAMRAAALGGQTLAPHSLASAFVEGEADTLR